MSTFCVVCVVVSVFALLVVCLVTIATHVVWVCPCRHMLLTLSNSYTETYTET